MISRSSSYNRSLTLQAGFPPCFPSASAAAGATPDLRTQRPRWKDPILDPNACSVPIAEFDHQAHSCFYGLRQDGAEADQPTAQPAQPEGFSDEYLVPSLTRNERLRLTMRECPSHYSCSPEASKVLTFTSLVPHERTFGRRRLSSTPPSNCWLGADFLPGMGVCHHGFRL